MPSKDQKLVQRRLKRYLETGHIKEVKDNLSIEEKPCVPHVWTTKLSLAAFSEESYALYRKYQIAVHNDAGAVFL